MKEYLFYIDGLNREVWQKGESERVAHKSLWDSLDSDEKDMVVIFDCIDERELVIA